MEWISLTEQKPKSGTPLLLCINGVVQRKAYDYDHTDQTIQDWYEEDPTIPVANLNTAFWMYLPAPPQ